MFKARIGASLLALGFIVTTSMNAPPAVARSFADIDRDVNSTLAKLYAAVPDARPLEKQAKAILVFPSIVKAGFMFGAQYGEGALRRQGKSVGYYNSVAASYGLQAGIQAFGYVLFFMTDSALRYLQESGGVELGVGPSIVVLDVGKAKALTTTTIQSEIYALIFDQTGLMGGLGLQGSKISRIDR